MSQRLALAISNVLMLIIIGTPLAVKAHDALEKYHAKMEVVLAQVNK